MFYNVSIFVQNFIQLMTNLKYLCREREDEKERSKF